MEEFILESLQRREEQFTLLVDEGLVGKGLCYGIVAHLQEPVYSPSSRSAAVLFAPMPQIRPAGAACGQSSVANAEKRRKAFEPDLLLKKCAASAGAPLCSA